MLEQNSSTFFATILKKRTLFSLREVLGAIQSFGVAHRFITEHRLWKWILIPGIVYCLMFVAGIIYVWDYSGVFIDYVLNLLTLKTWIEELQNGFVNFLFLLVGFAVRMVFLIMYFSFFKYLFLIVGSPLFAYLSEKTESIMQGKDFPFSTAQLLKDLWRGIRLSLRNLVYQTALMLILAILAFVPILGWLTPLIAMLVECYYFGFSMMDYSFERRRWTMRQSIAYIRQHKGMAMGNGVVFYLFLFIPVLGWLLAPCYAVIAATIHLQQQRLPMGTAE
ncbi:EI24 domain-containing protein [Chitinophaga rhizosphaerae]|uniref:EI24 domain-containing protein n=1 Tax=Chitinophaga rhizosphaerae TaxID=1864947 RepID=UPI001F0BD420|nr:EI24 domain-containing protein [Chitinophaga rhizosphaerae]